MMKTAVIGSGMISDIYLENMINRYDNLQVVACASRDPEHAKAKADRYAIQARTIDQVLDDPEIEMVVNLTPVQAHYEVIRRALDAGKHVFTEKALAQTTEQGKELIRQAERQGRYLGCAPETFLSDASAYAKSVIEEGRLGEITGFHISLNISLDIMYSVFRNLTAPGAGIGMDRGIYFLTELCYLLGEVEDACGWTRTLEPDRVIEPIGQTGVLKRIHIENENQMSALLKMKNGAIGTMQLNGNTIFPELSHIEIQGRNGIMILPNSNDFGGEVRILQKGSFDARPQWDVVPFENQNLRGIGPSRMAQAIVEGSENPISAQRAYHVMEVFDKILR